MKTPNEITLWHDAKALEEIKKIYAKDLNENEFKVFLNIGKVTNLNPFLREIWAVKYGNNAASIFIGRDGYRKSAQAHHDYDYHIADAVYSNDSFEINDAIPKHSYSFRAGRGELVGAYCLVKRKGSSKPNYVFVELKEYSTGKSLWATKPSTMIKKVAEAQGLRMTFQELFAGTYDESENWNDGKVNKETGEITEKKPSIREIKGISKDQVIEITDLFIRVIKNEDPEAQKKIITENLKKMYKVEAISQLSLKQAENLIPRLQKRLKEKTKSVEAVEVVQKTFPGAIEVNES